MSAENAKDGKPVTLRLMTASDMMTLYQWQCHPDTRRYARNPLPPELEGHKKWFSARVRSADCVLTMIMHGDEQAGMLRFDRLPHDQPGMWEVSIIVAPDKKRLGIGRAALALGRELMPEVEFIAEVLPGNEVSHLLFRKAGYARGDDALYHARPSK